MLGFLLKIKSKYNFLLSQPYAYCFIYGLLLAFSFAPFHAPFCAIFALALFFRSLTQYQESSFFAQGFFLGLGFFGLGVSWIYVSIHTYGHFPLVISAFITCFFIAYLALFPAIAAWVFQLIRPASRWYSALLFSALWVLAEWLRSHIFTGFPWLLIGVGQLDSLFKFLLPIGGVYGVSFYTCFIAAYLTFSFALSSRLISLVIWLLILFFPLCFKAIHWGTPDSEPISIGIVQANLSMRDKWDDALFWQLLQHYSHRIHGLLGTQLIVLPESAIPVPKNAISDFLESIDEVANQNGSAVLLGIPDNSTAYANVFFNALLSLGKAEGTYHKQHLVPFGEYIPTPFQKINNLFNLPETNLIAGKVQKAAVTVHQHPIAVLICYEIAYDELLRSQLPQAEWIVSISDNGWFGHSFALYQQLQIAQVRSLQTARYQVIANNDGLSSLIDTQGKIIHTLPAFQAGVLKDKLYAVHGETFWVKYGDAPIMFFSFLIFIISVYYTFLLNKNPFKTLVANFKRRYPYQPQ